MQIIKNSPSQIREAAIPDRLLKILPEKLSNAILPISCRGTVEEIRLRAGRRASVICCGENIMLEILLTQKELSEILSDMCGGSLYAYSDTINNGYISLPDGLRVGVCGRAACEGERIIGVYEISSLCIRIPHRHRKVGEKICSLLRQFRYTKGVLLYSPPGVGKTTALRGITARLAGGESPLRTVVIDTRGELSFSMDSSLLCLDVLSGYPRRLGIEIATRTLNAQVIICDEIGDYEEAMALVASHNCGVPLVASAHAGNLSELLSRTGIRLLHEAKIFGAYAGLRRAPNMDFYYDITLWDDAQREIGSFF